MYLPREDERRNYRKIDASNGTKLVDAYRSEKYLQAYFYKMETNPPEYSVQAKHKPYQCDVKLR